ETYATKFPDYTFLRTKYDSTLFRSNDTYCVEIKPKQGYLRDIDWKFQKCPYCLTQYYKLKKKIITSRSTYCPFDLFSGVEERMKSALKGLLKSPQNNLKIFKNGIVVYDQESLPNGLKCVLTEWFHNSVNSANKEYVDKFCNLICAALLHPFSSEEFKSNTSPAHELCISTDQDLRAVQYIKSDLVAKVKKLLYFNGKICNLKGETLPNNSVLERILRMQRLPFISSEYVYNTYLKFHSLLTDDIIYSNLLKLHKHGDHQISSFKQKVEDGNTEALRESYIQTCAKDSSISKKSKLDSDRNENKHINISNGNVPLISRSILFPINFEKTNLWYNESNIIHNEDNVHYNKKGTDSLTNTEISCLQNYLLFSCARDCSILMSFREVMIQLPDGHSFICNIGISDIDPKSLSCIEKHRQRDTDVLNSAISILEGELVIENQL
ncbi:Inositol-pentakisphosphate 2-kinase, partial [Habropoda laboriosa]